ncbi:nitrate- and nitrite sensing domain-containing protein [Streptomyces sp. NPDC101455]|uniref:sensor histidine kinase n=1 Tax=Streptomyces sp. NPDC101455 TaxID=3366142 RepID=UPI0037FC957E
MALLTLASLAAVPSWRQQDTLRAELAASRLGGEASLPLLNGAQAERERTAAYLADPAPANKAALLRQRAAMDQGVAKFRQLSAKRPQDDRRHPWEYAEQIYTQLDQLSALRRTVDSHAASVDTATGYYTQLTSAIVQFNQGLSYLDDPTLTLEARPLVGLAGVAAGLAQEDTLLAASRASGRMTPAHRASFAEAYGTRRGYDRWILPYLSPSEKRLYNDITSSSDWKTVQRVEQGVINAPGGASGASLDNVSDLAQWDSAYGRVTRQLAQLDLARTQGLLADGYARADHVRTRIYFVVVASLLAVAAVAALVTGLRRTVVRRSRQVRDQAARVAHTTLPEIVRALQQGFPADTSVLPTLPPVERDEFDQLEGALSALAWQAVHAANALHSERRGFHAFVVATSARAGDLIHNRVLGELDALQKQFTDNAPVLDRLYTLEHLVARIRRQIENAMVLSGGELDHRHDEPVHIGNIIVDAVGESAGRNRVRSEFHAEVWIAPHYAAELTHLLAELIDNAARFTPDDLEITVRSTSVDSFVLLDIEDRGVPLAPGLLESLNRRLGQAPPYSELQGSALGLFAVGHLAQYLGVGVRLGESVYGGLVAQVSVPRELWAAPVTDQPLADPLLDRSDRSVGAPPAAAPRPSISPSPSNAQPSPLPRRRAHAWAAAEGPVLNTAGNGLPRRVAGTHLAQQLRTSHDSHAADTHPTGDRALDQIAADFSVLDELAQTTEHGEN